MGSFFSSLFNPNYPAGVADTSGGDTSVVRVRNKASWDELFNTNKEDSNHKMVIDFSASWCGPCRAIAPVFDAFAARYTGVVFVKIDVDELPEVAQQWKVQAMPTFVIVKGGKEIGRVIGANKDELETTIKNNLNA